MRARCAGMIGLAVALAACASGPQIPPGSSCEITASRAPFYKQGPAQTFGADEMLAAGTRVTLIERSMGFSRVMLPNGVTGYVSNDDVSAVAPEVAPPAGSVVTNRKLDPLFTAPGRSSKPKRSNVQPTPSDPLFDVNDTPLPLKDEPPKATPAPEKEPE